MTASAPLRVAVPDQQFADQLSDLAGVEVSVWQIDDPAPATAFDLLVLPYMIAAPRLKDLPPGIAAVIQAQTLGYDAVADWLPPGFVFCNAVEVHEASTAELAMGLIIASQRGFPGFAAAQREGRWAHSRQPGVAGARILLLGAGGVSNELLRRLEPFEADVVRVARSARVDELGPIHAAAELPDLLPEADVVVVAVPLDEHTRGMVDHRFLDRMKSGALLVNVARGPVVDTGALLQHLENGHIRAALDVTDPEPLPPDHPLWRARNVMITPHVGGHTYAMGPRIQRVVRRQIALLQSGQRPQNIVIES